MIVYHAAPESQHFSLLLGYKLGGQGARPDTCNLNGNVIEACIMYQYWGLSIILRIAS